MMQAYSSLKMLVLCCDIAHTMSLLVLESLHIPLHIQAPYTSTQIHVRTHAHTHTHTHKYTYTYTYTYTQAHTCTHAQTQ